ncbi:MAG: hypothetical protein Q4D76_18930 [Oscillospiraceae bacterium]|nr:hypothetical protein [Oscillospiraceae bacterium]
MIFRQIKELVMQFLTNPFEYGFIQFRDDFDNIIDENRGALISEVKKEKYEIIDEIYMALEMYEENEAIRQMEPYCIDESKLVEKITVLFETLNSKGD